MKTFYYIKGNAVVSFPFELDKRYSISKVFVEDPHVFIELSAEQVSFYKDNLDASVREIWGMQRQQTEDNSMELLRHRKVQEIIAYNESDAVNSFIFQGQKLWVNREERVSFKSAVEAKIALGITDIELPIKQLIGVKLDCRLVLKMLYMLENYCSLADTQMKKHLYVMEGLADIEGINSYDYKEGMPEIINFDNLQS